VPLRRPGPFTALARLFAVTSTRTNVIVVAKSATSAGGKVLAVMLADRVVGGDIQSTALVGITGIVFFAAARVVGGTLQVDAHCDLHRALTRAIVEGDVLTSPTSQPLHALYEPTIQARNFVTETVPELVANVIAAVAVAHTLTSSLSARALLVGAVALGAVSSVLLLIGRASAAMQRRVWDASQEVLDKVAFAVEGRLELVARGADQRALRTVEQTLESYRATAKRSAWTLAMLGRAPLAAGLAAVVLAVVLDTSSREAVTAAVLKQALVLAACLPIIVGIVVRTNELVRAIPAVRPVLDVISAPPRAELARNGAPPPELPAAVTVRNVEFAYGDCGPQALSAVSFDWHPGEVLVVEGANGSGKSTLLRLLLGLRAPRAGTITIGGSDLQSMDLPELRRAIAYLPQRPYLGEAYAPVRSALLGLDDAIPDAVLHATLARLGLDESRGSADMLDVAIGELSAGQRQRISLARVLLHDASIYLLDEPDANLDRAGIALVANIIRELVQNGRMVAVAAHTGDLAELPGMRVRLG
jgi:ABC-type multidrug transport system fused ATPase/permease subunit